MQQLLFSLGVAVTACWLPLGAGSALAGPFSDEARDGIRQYNQEEYAQARRSFEAARQADPKDPGIAYNLANTDYRLGNFDHAIESYGDAEVTFQDPVMKQKALYNKGNALFRTGDVDGAIAAYKKALELDPDDRDAKYNLEYVRLLKQRAQQANRLQPKDMNQRQTPRPGGLNPTPQDQNTGVQKTKPDQKSNRPPENPPDSQPSEPDTPQGDEAASAAEHPATGPSAPSAQVPEEDRQTAKALQDMTAMSKPEAERWLHSLNEDLKKFSRRQLQGQMKDLFVKGDKDW